MHFLAAEWVRAGGQFPPMTTPGMAELAAAFTRTTYSFRGDRLLIEPKEMVKERLGYSPDHLDSFILTFAHPVASRRASGVRYQCQYEYDPFAENIGSARQRGTSRHFADYDPYREEPPRWR